MKGLAELLTNIKTNRKASVLILVLIVVSAMTTIVIAGAYRTKIAIRLAHGNSQRTKAYYLAIGGIERIKALLGSEELGPEFVGQISQFTSDWVSEGLFTDRVRNMSLSYCVRDELAHFNINSSDPACWENIAGISREIRSSIGDWTDEDGDTSPSGAENDYYQRLERPYGCKDGPMTRLKELCYVKGISFDMYRGRYARLDGGTLFLDENQSMDDADLTLTDIFTVYGDGRVNINTASSTILSALPGLDSQAITAVLNHRTGPDGKAGTDDDNYIKSAEFLAEIEGLSELQIELLGQYCCFGSSFFRVYSCAEVHKNRCVLMSTVEMAENSFKIISTERLL